MLFACPSAWQSSAQLTPAPLVPAVTLPQQELLPLKFSLVDASLLLHPVTDGTCERRSGCRLVWSQVHASWWVPPWLKLVKSFEGFPKYEAPGPRTCSCGKSGLANSSICGTECSFCLFFFFHWCQWSWYCKSAMLKNSIWDEIPDSWGPPAHVLCFWLLCHCLHSL